MSALLNLGCDDGFSPSPNLSVQSEAFEILICREKSLKSRRRRVCFTRSAFRKSNIWRRRRSLSVSSFRCRRFLGRVGILKMKILDCPASQFVLELAYDCCSMTQRRRKILPQDFSAIIDDADLRIGDSFGDAAAPACEAIQRLNPQLDRALLMYLLIVDYISCATHSTDPRLNTRGNNDK